MIRSGKAEPVAADIHDRESGRGAGFAPLDERQIAAWMQQVTSMPGAGGKST